MGQISRCRLTQYRKPEAGWCPDEGTWLFVVVYGLREVMEKMVSSHLLATLVPLIVVCMYVLIVTDWSISFIKVYYLITVITS